MNTGDQHHRLAAGRLHAKFRKVLEKANPRSSSSRPPKKLTLDPANRRENQLNQIEIERQKKLPPLTLEQKRADVRRHMAQAEQRVSRASRRP
jgi:hypothetical protein